jgi:serine protease AprX
MVVSILASTAQLPKANPQTLITKSYYQSNNGSATSNNYFMLNGTSMAAPVVSGAAALLIQQNPNLTPDQVKARLMKTASKSFPTFSSVTDPSTGNIYVDYYDVFTVGAGYLDIAAALANTDLATGTALSPTAVFDPSTDTATMVPDPSSIWDTRTLWAARTIWGAAQILDSSRTLWGCQTLWGSRTLWAARSLWAQTTPADTAIILVNGEP